MHHWTALLLSIVLTGSASALPPDAARLKQACYGDARSFCSEIRPGGGRIIGCLSQNLGKLSPACRAAITDHEKLKARPKE